MNPKRGRLQAVLFRWADIIVCGGCAAAGAELLERTSGIASRIAGRAQDPMLVMLIALASLGTFILVARGRLRGLLGLERVFVHPPLWVSAVFGFTFLLVASPHSPDSSLNRISREFVPSWQEGIVVLLLGLLTCQVVGSLYGRLRVRHQRLSTAQVPPRLPLQLSDFDRLAQWLVDDEPVTDPALDAFGHDAVARRIANRALRHLTSGQRAPSVAVVGERGSGKTTIARLVERRLQQAASVDHRVLFVRVSIWDYEDQASAIRAIIDAIVNAIGTEIDACGLAGIPNRYAAAITRSSGTWFGWLHLLSSDGTPRSTLEAIGKALCSSGLCCLLWIEDIERFGEQLGDNRGTIKSTDSIQSLMHILDRIPNLGVIIADASHHVRVDRDKLARYIERPPRCEPSVAWPLLSTFKRGCLAGAGAQTLDLDRARDRESTDLPTQPNESKQRARGINDRFPGYSEALALLLSNPRIMKAVLRGCLEDWQVLRGEIDFDDLLASWTIRIVAPEIFAVIDRRVDDLRHRRRLHARPDEERIGGTSVETEMAESMSRLPTPTEDRCTRTLLYFLFPALKSPSDIPIEDRLWKPQGVAVRGSDYWERIVSHELPSMKERDQVVMRSIRRWQSGEPTDLLDRCMSPFRSDSVERFVVLFKRTELVRLFEEICERSMLDRRGRDPQAESGVVPIWRMMLAMRPRPKEIADSVERVLVKTVPLDLPLAHTVQYFLCSHEPNQSLFDEESGRRIRRLFMDAVKALLVQGELIAIRDAIDGGVPYLLHWCCFGLDRIRTDDVSDVPLDSWALASSKLLAAAAKYPKDFLPQLVPFMTRGGHYDRLRDFYSDDEKRGSLEYRSEFDANRCRLLFDYDEVMRLFHQHGRELHVTGDQFATALRAVIEECERWAMQRSGA